MNWHPASKERMLASKGWMLGESFAFAPTNESLAYYVCLAGHLIRVVVYIRRPPYNFLKLSVPRISLIHQVTKAVLEFSRGQVGL